MAWPTGFPLSDSTDVGAYEFIRQFYYALRERSFAAGDKPWPRYPRTNEPWDEGIVTSATATTIGDSARTGSLEWIPDWWNGVRTPPAPDWIPTSYDVVIHDEDETKVVKAHITTNDENTLTITDIQHVVTEGWIPSLASLVGKRYYIIKADGLWYSDRIMQWANDPEYDLGTVSHGTELSLTDTTKNWSVDQWTSTGSGSGTDTYEVITTQDGEVVRLLIHSNTQDTLIFGSGSDLGSSTPAPTGDYIIVKKDGRATLGRKAGMPGGWYGLHTLNAEAYTSHDVDDVLRATYLPATLVDWSEGIPPDFCETVSHDAFDVDLWSGLEEECSTADRCYSPSIFKSLRFLQQEVERLCYQFVESKTYDGETAIETFTEATLFHKAGINSHTTTASAGSSDVDFTLTTLPYNPITMYWTILDERDVKVSWGVDDVSSTTFTQSLSGYSGQTLTLIYSWGWTRFFPREFRYYYDKRTFTPGTDEFGDPVSPTDADGETGSWSVRPKSTSYKVYNSTGRATDSGSFVTDDIARYSGDCFNDPVDLGGDALLYEYEDAKTEVIYEEDHQREVDNSMRGTVTSGGDGWMTDSSKDWFNTYPLTGVSVTHEGTATGGTPSSLSDTTKSSSFFWDTDTGRWEGFILEVDKSVGSGSGSETITFKTPITSYSGGTTLSFRGMTIGSTTLDVNPGDVYRIREPMWVLNRWKDRELVITRSTGESVTVTITHSDDDTLWFAEDGSGGAIVYPGDTYAIREKRPAEVYKWDGSSWIVPGSDSVADPRGEDWVDNLSGNLPTAVKKYGRYMKGDYLARHVWEELYNAINELVWTKHTFTWTANLESNVMESDGPLPKWGYGVLEGPPSDTYHNAFAEYLTNVLGPSWGTSPYPMLTGPVDDVPYAVLASGASTFPFGIPSIAGEGGFPTPTVVGRYAYPIVTGIPTCMDSEVEFLAYSVIDATDPDEGVLKNWACELDGGYLITTYEETKYVVNGAPLKFRQFSTVDTMSPDNAETRQSAVKVGDVSTAIPTWPLPDDPLDHQYDCSADGLASASIRSGFLVTTSIAVVKWNVTGGMQYTA